MFFDLYFDVENTRILLASFNDEKSINQAVQKIKKDFENNLDFDSICLVIKQRDDNFHLPYEEVYSIITEWIQYSKDQETDPNYEKYYNDYKPQISEEEKQTVNGWNKRAKELNVGVYFPDSDT